MRRFWGGRRDREVFQMRPEEPLTVAQAVERAATDPHGPKDGIVAVKVDFVTKDSIIDLQ